MVTTSDTFSVLSEPSHATRIRPKKGAASMIEFEFAGLAASTPGSATEALPALLARYRAGDEYAFTILFTLSIDRVMAGLARSLRHPQYRPDFDDAVQVSYFALSQRSELFVMDCELIGWLTKTAANAAINFHRRRRPTADSEFIYQATKRVLLRSY